jgi:hypothetical protein
MRIRAIVAAAVFGISVPSFGQLTISNGSNVLEISGLLSTTYTQRFLPAGSINFKKDVFGLNTARFKLEGRYGHNYEYQLQLDFSRLGFSADGEFPAVLDANFTYKGLRFMDVEVGYQKVPYSRSSLTPFSSQPFWQRAEIARGGIFSRRDIGVCLSRDFWKQRINLVAGVFSGQGEYSLTSVTGGDNDPSGKLEYVARADIAWPCRYRYSEVLDVKHVPVPMFALGINGRYVERSQSLPAGLVDYDLKIVAGKRTSLGFDLAAQYKGFSALFEMHQMTIRPDSNSFDNTKPLLLGKPTNYFRFGGVIAQLAYYNRKIKSGFLIRYDEFDPSDLVLNNTERTISYGYNFLLDGFRSMIRVQYWQRVGPWKDGGFQSVTQTPGLLRVNDQIRVGWQYAF